MLGSKIIIDVRTATVYSVTEGRSRALYRLKFTADKQEPSDSRAVAVTGCFEF